MTELVTFGDTALQLSPRGAERLASARGADVHAEGVESGAAVAAATLGGESTWVTHLPDSPQGRLVAGRIREHGVGTEITWTDPDGDRQGIVFRDPGRAPRETAVSYDCGGTPFAAASPADLPMDLVQEATVVFTGASSAVLSERAARTSRAVLRAARGSGATTAVALDYRPGLRSPEHYREVLGALVDHLDVLIVGAEGAGTVFDAAGRSREVAHTLAAEFDLGTVVVVRTDGGGVALRDTPGTDVVHERDAVDTDVVDVTGQTAAFAGAFLWRLAAGRDVPVALTGGVAAGALACTVPGPLLTATPTEIDRVGE
jgi:2-dehydro-3-deoxygluconokinase